MHTHMFKCLALKCFNAGELILALDFCCFSSSKLRVLYNTGGFVALDGIMITKKHRCDHQSLLSLYLYRCLGFNKAELPPWRRYCHTNYRRQIANGLLAQGKLIGDFLCCHIRIGR